MPTPPPTATPKRPKLTLTVLTSLSGSGAPFRLVAAAHPTSAQDQLTELTPSLHGSPRAPRVVCTHTSSTPLTTDTRLDRRDIPTPAVGPAAGWDAGEYLSPPLPPTPTREIRRD